MGGGGMRQEPVVQQDVKRQANLPPPIVDNSAKLTNFPIEFVVRVLEDFYRVHNPEKLNLVQVAINMLSLQWQRKKGESTSTTPSPFLLLLPFSKRVGCEDHFFA